MELNGPQVAKRAGVCKLFASTDVEDYPQVAFETFFTIF